MRDLVAGRRLAFVLAGVATLGVTGARADGLNADWSGFYAGGQLGGAWSNIDWQFQNANYFNTLGTTVVGNDFSHDPKGVIGGVIGGYNYQTGPWLLGLELSASAANMNQELPSPLFPKLDTTTTSVRWLTTITGRLGYAWNRWLLYGKGGWAGGDVKVTALDEDVAVYAAESQWANGWTVGGGAEYMIWDCTSLGVAYDYADLSIDNKTVTCPNCNGSAGVPGFGTPIVNGDVKVQSVMARLTFHQ
jgi:outer membrane immunogenic protein